MIKVLFVCSANVDRSPTAEYVYASHKDLEVKSAGTANYARVPLSVNLLQWADVILCMEERHKQIIEQKYPDAVSNKNLECLDIPDRYEYKSPPLIKLIKEKVDSRLLKYKQSK